jgi:hypothetical protein
VIDAVAFIIIFVLPQSTHAEEREKNTRNRFGYLARPNGGVASSMIESLQREDPSAGGEMSPNLAIGANPLFARFGNRTFG